MAKSKKTEAAAKKEPSEAAKAFAELVELFRFQQPQSSRRTDLTNFTFWAGAGFSKSWDSGAPVGSQLFTLKQKSLEDVLDFSALERMLGLEGDLTSEDLRQLVYQLDMYEKYPDVCSRYIDPQNIQIVRAGLRAAVMNRYEEIAPINYRDESTGKFLERSPTPEQKAIVEFFDFLRRCSDGSNFFAEGLRFHFATTNYDYVIETILDNIVGPDDSHHLYTYRGFTPSEIVGVTPRIATHQHWLVDHLLKLNGGFEILRSGERYRLDYSKRSRAQIIEDPPVLMLASREQDYTDPYFRTIFPKAVRLMRDSRVLILVGYSLPDDDALMRFIIRQFAEEPEDGKKKYLFYVDRLDKADKLAKLKSVFPSIHTYGVPRVFTFEGSFADFAAECLQVLGGS
jgi:hypothetical protein